MERETGFEQLFEEREWVRALAERLCADAAAAEDLAQDTWLEALREGGKARGARGWLGGVLRNLVARRRTRDAARAAREHATARPEAVPGPEELLARAELQRRVLSAVADLPESYRSVVLLRHYEGLSAEDIARRSGESGSTVRNRLARAHALLRERLDRDYGERSLWSTLLVPVSWGVSKEVVTGGMLVGAKLYVTAAAVALVGAVLWMQREETNAVAESLASAEVGAQNGAPIPPDSNDTAQASETRREVAQEAAAPRFGSVLVHGELRGATEPIDSGSLTFVDALGQTRRATVNGTTFAVPGLQPGEWRISAALRGYRLLDQRIEIDGSKAKERHDLEFEALRSLRVKLVDAVTGDLLKPSLGDPLLSCLSVVATRTRDAGLPRTMRRRLLESEAGSYLPNDGYSASERLTEDCSGVLTLTEAPPLWLHAVVRDVVIATQAFDGGVEEVVFELDLHAMQRLNGSVLVRCVDDTTGAVLVGANVEASFEDGRGGGKPTDAEGFVRLANLAPGLRRVTAGVAGRPTTSFDVRIEPGTEIELELRMPLMARIMGRVVAGGAGQKARIEFLPYAIDAAKDRWLDVANFELRSNANFEVPGIPARRHRVVVSAEGFAPVVRDVDATRGEAQLGEIELEKGTSVVVRSALGDARLRTVWLLDALGAPLARESVYPVHPVRWTLKPGSYGLRVLREASVVEDRAFVVGQDLVQIELGVQ